MRPCRLTRTGGSSRRLRVRDEQAVPRRSPRGPLPVSRSARGNLASSEPLACLRCTATDAPARPARARGRGPLRCTHLARRPLLPAGRAGGAPFPPLSGCPVPPRRPRASACGRKPRRRRDARRGPQPHARAPGRWRSASACTTCPPEHAFVLVACAVSRTVARFPSGRVEPIATGTGGRARAGRDRAPREQASRW